MNPTKLRSALVGTLFIVMVLIVFNQKLTELIAFAEAEWQYVLYAFILIFWIILTIIGPSGIGVSDTPQQ